MHLRNRTGIVSFIKEEVRLTIGSTTTNGRDPEQIPNAVTIGSCKVEAIRCAELHLI